MTQGHYDGKSRWNVFIMLNFHLKTLDFASIMLVFKSNTAHCIYFNGIQRESTDQCVKKDNAANDRSSGSYACMCVWGGWVGRVGGASIPTPTYI